MRVYTIPCGLRARRRCTASAAGHDAHPRDGVGERERDQGRVRRAAHARDHRRGRGSRPRFLLCTLPDACAALDAAWHGIPYGTVVDALADSPLAPAGGDRAGGQVFSFGDDAHGKLGHGASAAELAAAAGGVPQSSDADDVKHEVRVGYTSMACLGRQLRWRTPSARPAHSRLVVRGRCLALALRRAPQIPALPLRRRTPPPSARARAHPHHAWALWRTTQARKLTRLLSRTPRRIDALASLAIVEISAGLGHSAAVDVVGRLCVRRTALSHPRAPRSDAPRPFGNADRPRPAAHPCASTFVRARGLSPQVCVGRERARAARVRRPDGPRGADARRGRRAVQHALRLGRAGGR